MAPDTPRVLLADRVGPIIEGVVTSRTRDKKYLLRILVGGNILCGCESSRMGGRTACPHARALLESMEKEDLIEAILAGARDPDQ